MLWGAHARLPGQHHTKGELAVACLWIVGHLGLFFLHFTLTQFPPSPHSFPPFSHSLQEALFSNLIGQAVMFFSLQFMQQANIH